ncbi:MAG: class I adenylate-forming enzyme family protein [Terracoccus sp.]
MTTIGDPDRPTVAGPAPNRSRAGAWVGDTTNLTADASVAITAARLRLCRLGVRGGDRVLVRDSNSPELVVIMAALALEDVSIVLLDERCERDLLVRAAAEACVSWVIGSRGILDIEPVTQPASPCFRDLGPARELVDLSSLSDGHEEAVEWRFDPAPWERREDALIMWTSGTTGAPKGLVRSGTAVMTNLRATAEAMRYTSDDVLLPLLPLTHQYGMSMVLLWAMTGCGMVIGSPARPEQTLAAAIERGATVVDAPPSTYADLLARPRGRGVVSGSSEVRMWCVGGAPLLTRLADDFRRLTGQPLLDGYGQTEVGNVALATADDPTALGRALSGVQLQIRGSRGPIDTPEVTGAIWVRSPGLYSYDLARQEPVTDDGWFATGDIGSLDHHGRLTVRGRDNAVHRAGFTIHPCALEARADRDGYVVKVVAVPDDRLGHHLTAIVQDEHVRSSRFWAERLRTLWAEYEWPNQVLVLGRLPRTSTGKADHRALTTLAAGRRRPTKAAGPY